MKALVIDDSSATRFMVCRMLKEMGFQCEEASNGKEALDRLSQGNDFSVALLDWNMPTMNGLEMLLELRKPEYQQLKVIMITTETEMMQVVRAIEAGVDEYLMKPFTKEMIEDKMSLLGLA